MIKSMRVMKTTKLFNSIILPAFVAALLLAGCEPEDFFNFSPNVTFTASTGYDNLPSTKTIYSGEETTVGSKTYERIDWVPGDLIRVYSNVATTPSNGKYADYKVTGATASGRKSKATITNVAEHGLIWGDGINKFYAMYPSPSTEGVPSDTDFSISSDGLHATITGSIPPTQWVTKGSTTNPCDTVYQPDMRYAYMWADFQSQRGQTVDLEFHPAVTALEFTVCNNQSEAININSVGLCSKLSPLTGHMEVLMGLDNSGVPSISQSTLAWEHGVTDTITVKFAPSGSVVTVNPGKSVSFTVLTVPHNISGLDVTIKGSRGGEAFSKKLELKDDSGYVIFLGSKKYHICIGAPGISEDWTYYVEDIANISLYGHLASLGNDFTVKSYRTKGTVTEPVKWKVQYATSTSGPWSDTQPSSWQTNGAKFSISNPSGSGSLPSVGEVNSANILRDHLNNETATGEYYDSEQAAIAVMQARGTLPSTTSDAGDGYFDLSKHPIYPVSAIDGAETVQETANCYIVTRPGKYKFPLVYGNAIRNGSTNQKAYAPTASEASNYYLRNFVRHDNQPIVDPWLKNNDATPTSVIVVWQDVKDEDHRILLEGSSDLFIDGDYVKFEIKNENIRPGNILIAAKKGSDIVWSWHIWVTEKDLSPHTVIDKTGRTNGMMEYNLGWTDKGTVKGNHWNDWKFYVRIIQTDASGNILNATNPQNADATGAADVFSVIQYGESITVDANVGSNCFYQWGRKDPILPATTNGDHTSSINKHYFSSHYTIHVDNHTVVTESNAGGFGYSIKNPYIVLYTRPSYQYHSSKYYGNLWDVDLIANQAETGGNAISINNRLSVKSVYDPSPRGYVVPYTFAFTGFSKKPWNENNPGEGNGTTAEDGINFNDGNGGKIYFPYAGARGGNAVTPLYDVTNTMYYWAAGKLPSDSSNEETRKKSKNFTCLGLGDVRAIWDQYSEGAYAVRPVLQVEF